MIAEYEIDALDRIPQPFLEPENPFTTHRREVGQWEQREEAAWMQAGCPDEFEFQEKYPVRPGGKR